MCSETWAVQEGARAGSGQCCMSTTEPEFGTTPKYNYIYIYRCHYIYNDMAGGS